LKPQLEDIVKESDEKDFCLRSENNPFLKPDFLPWRNKAIFNAAAINYDGKIFILYRAFGDRGRIIRKDSFCLKRKEGFSNIGLAIVDGDGFYYDIIKNYERPVIRRGRNSLGKEDPRMTRIEGYDEIFITCFDTFLGRKGIFGRPELIVTKDFRDFRSLGYLNIEGYTSEELYTKNVVLFPEKINGKFALLHRPTGEDIEKSIYVAFSDDLINFYDSKKILAPREGYWDSKKVGAGPPPIKLGDKWLLLYHGADERNVYSMGYAIFDKDLNVVKRSDKPLIFPQTYYEKGTNREVIMPNVVFSCGAVLNKEGINVIYGAADTFVAGGIILWNSLGI